MGEFVDEDAFGGVGIAGVAEEIFFSGGAGRVVFGAAGAAGAGVPVVFGLEACEVREVGGEFVPCDDVHAGAAFDHGVAEVRAFGEHEGATFLADTVTGRAQATVESLERLAAVLPTLPVDVQFLLSATEVDKRRTFYLTLKKLANLEVFDLIDTSKGNWEGLVADLVARRSEEYGLQFHPEAMDLFVMMAGENTRQIENELEKIDLYLGEKVRRVMPDDVRAIVSQTKGSVVFELGNAIAKRRLPLALALVDELMAQDEAPIGILLAAVVPTVRNLFAAKQLEERYGIRATSYNEYTAQLERKLSARERDRLPKKKDGSGLNAYPLFLAAREAGAYSRAELQRALEECLVANRRLVTSGLDPVIVLNQLLFRVLPPSGR